MKKTLYETLFEEKLILDAMWEFEDSIVSIVKKNIKETSAVSYTLKVNDKVNKYDVVINLNENRDKFVGFCNCSDAVKEGVCKHMVMAVKVIEGDLVASEKIEEIIKTDTYKYQLLKNIYMTTSKHDLISLDIGLIGVSEYGFKIKILANIFSKRSYTIKNIKKFVEKVNNNEFLNYGKEFETHNYKIDPLSQKTFEYLELLSYSFENTNRNLNEGYLELEEFKKLINTKKNQEIYYNEEIYLIKERLDDIILDIKLLDNGSYNIHLRRSSYFQELGSNLVINKANKVIYLLSFSQMQKIKLLESFDETDKNFLIGKDNSEDFINDVLPNIYNEFTIKLDNKMDYKIIDEQFSSTIYCHLVNKVIHVKLNFLYGEYNVDNAYEKTLIKRNYHKEQQVMQILINQGYMYDPESKEFVIAASRSQFYFLTKNIFILRQEFEVFLDDKLKNSILKYDSNNIKINIMQQEDKDYFDFDFELGDIKNYEIDAIINSFEKKREFHKLENENFLKLDDQKLLHQLLFLKEVIGDTSHKLNTHRIPKYKSFLVKEQASKLFTNVTVNQEFENYIDQILAIEDVDYDLEKNREHYHLREYQKVGVNWLNTLYKAELGALLADEMGLGKTLQLIAFLNLNNIDNALIVMPKALLYNWVQEFKKFAPHQKIVVLEGTRTQREIIVKSLTGHEIVLVSYNTLINDHDILDGHQFEVMVLDEAQYIKNSQTKTSRISKKISAKFYVALTGTPIENNLVELWSIFDYIIPGYLSDLNNFLTKYVTQKDKKQLQVLKDITKPFILRRYKNKVLEELPDKIVVDIVCEMEETQSALYARYIEDIHKKDIYNLRQMEVLTALTRLRQIAIDPSLLYDEYLEVPTKYKNFDEIISQIVSSKQKVVVFSQYTTVLKKLQLRLDNNGIKNYYLDGKTKPKQRMMDVEKFNKNNVPVYLISLKAGGVGLNLTSAQNVIIFDPWWNPATEAQAIDRTHRIGQKSTVEVFRFITKSTIEEKISEMNFEKLKVAQEILDDDVNFVSKLSSKELTNLLLQ